MIYTAIVLDNSEFFQKGTITVRISRFYSLPMTWDMSEKPAIYDEFKELKRAGKVEDFNNCLVSSLFGGGRNYGMFVLPQINSVGMVAFLDDSFNLPVWLGSYFRPIKNDEHKIEYVNIPNDQMEQEGEGTDGSKGGKNIAGDEGTIIIRTKKTDEENYDWEENNTENLVIIGTNKFQILHFLEWDGTTPKKWQNIQIENGEIKIEVKNDTDSKSGHYLLDEDSFTAEIDDGGEKSTMKLSNEDNSFELTVPKDVKLLGDANFLVKYSELSDALDRIFGHAHTCPITGMTVDVLDAGKPISSSASGDVGNMKTERIKTE